MHSAELDVTIKGIIIAEFCTGTWFGRRNIVDMKCAHVIACRSFSKSGSQFVKRETLLMVRNKCYYFQKTWGDSVFSLWAGVPQMERTKKGIEFSFGLIIKQLKITACRCSFDSLISCPTG